MTDATISVPATAETSPFKRDIGIKRRYAAERRFRLYGLIAIFLGLLFLVILLWTVFSKGYTAFEQTSINLPITFSADVIDPKGTLDNRTLLMANYPKLASEALVRELGIDPSDKKAVREAGKMISAGSRTQLRDMVIADPSLIGKTVPVWILATAEVDSALKGQVDLSVDEKRRRISDQQVEWMNQLVKDGTMVERFNWGLFTNGASSRPEMAGVGVAIIGSLYMMLIVLVLALPIGVAASIYLEEFAPQQPLDRPDRGQHQQSCGSAVDRLRTARACGLHQFRRPSAIGFRSSAALCSH